MGKKKLANFPSKLKEKGKKEDPSKISGNDIFEIDQEEINKQERRRRNIDEVESYEFTVAEKVDKNDDEEIDSDEAFNDSDEERFDHFVFRGSNQKGVKKQLDKEIDLSETEESDDEEDDEEDEINEDYEDQEDESEIIGVNNNRVRFIGLSGSDSDEDEVDEEVKALVEEYDYDNDVQEIDSETKADNLVSFIGSLDKKRKRTDDDEISSLEKPKRQFKERTEAYEESEYNLSAKDSSNVRKKIDLHDLIGSIQEETGFSGLKQKLASLESGGNKGTYKEPLSAPLPPRTQEKLNRQAAYEETNKDVTKWEPIVKQNREAEHLKFPMNAPLPHKLTSSTLASTFQPSTELEKEVDSILAQSGVKEKNLQQYEELQMSKLSVEEVKKRVNELRKMRELAFREEIKARRIAKIKSKTYRKIRKKEKSKLNLKQLAELDPKLAREEQLKLEIARAQERITLRHKNTSRWAKQTLKHGRHDSESRQAIAEQLQRHEELKRKIHDLGSDDELDYFSSEKSESSDIEKDDIDSIKEKASDELAKLEQEKSANEETGGLFGMKFMRIAMENEKNRTRGMIDDFIEDLENEEGTRKEMEKSSITHVEGNPGRMIFGGSSKKSASERKVDIKKLSESIFDPKSSPEVKSKDESSLNEPTDNFLEANSEEENPWLQTDPSKVVLSSKKSNKGIVKENKSDKLISKLKKHKGQNEQNGIEIDINKVFTIDPVQISNDENSNVKGEINSSTAQSDKTTNLESAEDDPDTFDVETNFAHVKSSAAFSQRELVARAFANDNVIEEFEAEKQAIIDEDEPKEQDLTLPGWGSWGGKGVKKPKKKKLVLAKPTPGSTEASKRKDINLQHVIINEKRVKKAKKYLSTSIPHPFETSEQYERSLCTPLGSEWNTQEVFQKIVTPRVITKIGTVIDPLSVPFHTKNLDE